MTKNFPPLPDTDWELHMPATQYEPEWTSSQPGYNEEMLLNFAERCVEEAKKPLTKFDIMSALALVPSDLSHPERCQWIAEALNRCKEKK